MASCCRLVGIVRAKNSLSYLPVVAEDSVVQSDMVVVMFLKLYMLFGVWSSVVDANGRSHP